MQLHRPFATVTPTLDGDVLTVLASADVTFTIPQIRRILTTVSGEGIRKVLTRLTAQGIVLHDQVGRTNTYRLNTEHLAAEPILALSRLTETFLNRLGKHLAAWQEPPTYAAVFGSAATGHMTLDSDIDVFLVRVSPKQVDREEAPGVWEQQVAELARSVTRWTGNDCRVVEYTEEEIRAAAAAREPLLSDIAKQGLTVAGMDLEAGDWEGIVDNYVNEDPAAEPLRTLAHEIDDLREGRAEPDLKRFLVRTVGVDYGPDPLTYKEWLGQIADRLCQHAVRMDGSASL